jgi:hypothetical protein
MASRAREEMPVRELKSQGSMKLVAVRLSVRKRPMTPGRGDGDGDDEGQHERGSGANVGDDAKNPSQYPPESCIRYADEKEAEAEEGPVAGVHSGLKDKVLADAGCGILQGLGHQPDAAHAREEEDAMAQVLALHQEIDGENDHDAEGPDGVQEAQKELEGLELGASGVHDANGLGLREWLPGAGSEIPADVLDCGESLFQRLLGWRVDRGYLFLDAETVGGKFAGDVEELVSDDVPHSADDGEGQYSGDCNGEYAREASGLKAADRRDQQESQRNREGEGDKKVAGKKEREGDDREHQERPNPGNLVASSKRHTTSWIVVDGLPCPNVKTVGL